MPRSRVLRLSVWYLGVIMAISVFFSFVLYNVTVTEANRGLERQARELSPNLYFVRPSTIDAARNEQLDNYRRHVIWRLVLVNTGMFCLGSGLSYILAKRNLEPLENSLQAQARFTSDAAHELRTPLTAMKLEIEVALRDKKLGLSGAKKLLNSNLEEIAQLDTLTKALLRLANNSNASGQNISPVEINKVIDLAWQRVAPQAAAKAIKLEHKLSDKLVKGDQDQLVELLVILLDNAIKYSGKKSQISITSKTSGDNLEISIKDEGIGINASDLTHIFERFYRADQSRSKLNVPGFGLGLSLAKQIVQAHHGHIFADSRPGKGTTIRFMLPLAR